MRSPVTIEFSMWPSIEKVCPHLATGIRGYQSEWHTPIAGVQFFWMSVKFLQLTLQYADTN